MDRQTQNLQLLELLYQALAEPFGIILRTNSVHRLRQRLYDVRKDKPELSRLSFHPSPIEPETELWIRNNEEKASD